MAAVPRRSGHMRSGRLASAVTAAMLAVASGCGSTGSATCVSNGIGEVCATSADGAIEFSGAGLEPGSDVTVDYGESEPAIFVVGANGTFDPDSQGLLAYFAGTEFTFGVSAIDDQGGPIEGDITVST